MFYSMYNFFKTLILLKIIIQTVYKNFERVYFQERDFLQLGAEPYKCDNAKLIRECNDLHQAFIHFKEQHEKIQRGKY